MKQWRSSHSHTPLCGLGPSTGSHPEAALQKLFSWRPLAAEEERAMILNEALEEPLTSVQSE